LYIYIYYIYIISSISPDGPLSLSPTGSDWRLATGGVSPIDPEHRTVDAHPPSDPRK